MAAITPSPAHAVRARILIVDDDDDIRETIEQILLDEGYDVTAAANGMDALRVLRASPHPALILLDLMMPVLNGYEFCSIKARDPELAAIPTVVISAAVKRGASDPREIAARLDKPVDLDRLLATIEHVLAGRGGQLPASARG